MLLAPRFLPSTMIYCLMVKKKKNQKHFHLSQKKYKATYYYYYYLLSLSSSFAYFISFLNFILLIFNIVLEAIANIIRQEKDIWFTCRKEGRKSIACKVFYFLPKKSRENKQTNKTITNNKKIQRYCWL